MDVLDHGLEPWTFDDLVDLPDSLWHYEIVDGGLLMTSPAGVFHEVVSDALRPLLRAQVPPEHRVLGMVGVDIHPTYLIPDLMILPPRPIPRGLDRVAPSDLLLVIEIVSPGSVSTDRILKPAKYAAAGIPNYWRVETRPETSPTAYVLPPDADVYTEVGTWKVGETARLAAPFDLTIPIADLEK